MQCLALFPISYGPGGSNSGLTLVIFLVHVALLSFIKLKLFLSDSKIINKLGLRSTKISSQDECMFKGGGAIIFFLCAYWTAISQEGWGFHMHDGINSEAL